MQQHAAQTQPGHAQMRSAVLFEGEYRHIVPFRRGLRFADGVVHGQQQRISRFRKGLQCEVRQKLRLSIPLQELRRAASV